MGPTINWAAIVVATIIPLAVGAIWYGQKGLGKYWMRANNFTPENMRGGNMALIFTAATVLAFLLAFFLMGNVTGPGQEAERYGTFQHGMVHGFGLTLMVVSPILGTTALFERRGWPWFLVHVGYWLISLMLMAGVLSAWR